MTDPNQEQLIRASVEAARRLLPVPSTRWGTVENYDPLREQTTVVVDGDSEATPAVNATGSGFTPGQRVLVLFTPPKGVHIVGQRPGAPVAYTPDLTGIDVGDGTVTGEYLVNGGLIDFAVLIVFGTGGSSTGTIEIGLPVQGSTQIVAHWMVVARALIGAARYSGVGAYEPATPTVVRSFGSDGLGLWGPTTPATWGPGDNLRVTGRYPRRLPSEDIAE